MAFDKFINRWRGGQDWERWWNEAHRWLDEVPEPGSDKERRQQHAYLERCVARMVEWREDHPAKVEHVNSPKDGLYLLVRALRRGRLDLAALLHRHGAQLAYYMIGAQEDMNPPVWVCHNLQADLQEKALDWLLRIAKKDPNSNPNSNRFGLVAKSARIEVTIVEENDAMRLAPWVVLARYGIDGNNCDMKDQDQLWKKAAGRATEDDFQALLKAGLDLRRSPWGGIAQCCREVPVAGQAIAPIVEAWRARHREALAGRPMRVEEWVVQDKEIGAYARPELNQLLALGLQAQLLQPELWQDPIQDINRVCEALPPYWQQHPDMQMLPVQMDRWNAHRRSPLQNWAQRVAETGETKERG